MARLLRRIKPFLFIAIVCLCHISSAQYEVTNTSDAGAGSLRQAIINANASSGRETITFNIPGAGPWQIDLLSPIAVDNVNDAGMVIDATTQPGFAFGSANNMIILDGGASTLTSLDIAEPGTSIFGLYIRNFDQDGLSAGAGSSSLIVGAPGAGNVISGNTRHGLDLNGSVNAVVQGNRIGTSADGLTADGNGSYGIRIQNAAGTQIGGDRTAGEGNLISGNGLSGINVRFTDNVSIYGNLVGTDATGNNAIGNAGGILVNESSDNIIIGGTGIGQGNVISGCTGTGAIRSTTGVLPPNTGLTIENNIIGLNVAGNAPIPNANRGITITTAGTGPGMDYVIRSNTIAATSVPLEINNIQGNTIIEANKIGTNINGNAGTGFENGGDGIELTRSNGTNSTTERIQIIDNIIVNSSANGIEFISAGNDVFDIVVQRNRIGIDASGIAAGNGGSGLRTEDGYNMEIGGTGDENIFANNAEAGIQFFGAAAQPAGSTIGVNNYFCNGTVGIDYTLAPSVASPIVGSLTTTLISGTSTVADGSLVEVYAVNSTCGDDQGATYLGQAFVSGGAWSLGGIFNTSATITATVTDITLGISEFGTSLLPISAFITTWKTDNAGSSNPDQITLPTTGAGYDYSVDWGDGSFDASVTGNITHTYPIAGTYTVSITGSFPRIFFNNTGDRRKILTVEQWGSNVWTSLGSAFRGCENLTINASDAPDLSVATSMAQAFMNCTSFNQSINHWDVSNITDMNSMFNGATSFNQPLNSWNVSNVQIMSNMFSVATSFNQDISGWNTANVTTMSRMFDFATAFNQPIGSWNVGNVTDMYRMFAAASTFNQNINTWNVSEVTTMEQMFQSASVFNQPLNNWDVGMVNTMSQMFVSANQFNQDLNSWDVSTVNTMMSMFNGAGSFNGNISAWDVSTVSNMAGMFNGATSFNQDIGNWNVGAVTNMAAMFLNASIFNQDIGSWNTSGVSDMSNMFSFAIAFNQDIGGWDVFTVSNFTNMFNGAATFNQYLGEWVLTAASNMTGMFSFTGAFNQDMGGWDVSNVQFMANMFWQASAFDQSLGSWNVGNVSTMGNMLRDCGMSIASYDNTLIGWASLPSLQTGNNLGADGLNYCAAIFDHAYLMSNYSWTITDAGLLCPPFNFVSSNPNNAANISLSGPIELTFDDNVDATTLLSSTIQVRGSHGGLYAISLSGGGTSTISISHVVPFRPGEIVRVNVTTGLMSESASILPGPVSLEFRAAVADGPATPDAFVEKPSNYITASEPGEIIYAADVDSDGDMDIIGLGSDELAWFENDGTQNFTEHFLDNVTGLLQVHAADLDDDGDMDVLSYGNDTYNWYENDGSENFTHHFIDDFSPAESIGQAWPIDMDGDGDLDIVAAFTDLDEVVWYNNDGSQNFTRLIIDNVAIGVSSVWPSDVNGDGFVDVIATYDQNVIVIYLNDGAVNFTADPITVPWTASHVGLTGYAGDLDGDGDIDLIYSNSNGQDNVWLENDGTGSFTQHDLVGIVGGERFFMADMDGDNDMDLLKGVFAVGILWYENDGNENFTEHTIKTTTEPVDLVPVDMDGDGDLDLVSAFFDLAWFENTGPGLILTGTTPAINEINVLISTNLTLTFSDNIDAATVNSTAILITGDQTGIVPGTFSGGGTNTITFDPTNNFKNGEIIRVSLTTGLQNTSGGALTRDHHLSFITISAPAPESPPLFQERTIYNDGTNTGVDRVVAIDMDLDGDLDVASIYEGIDEGIAWYQNDGAEMFTRQVVATPTMSFPEALAAADLDLDGDIDLLGAYNGRLDWYENDGAYNFTPIFVYQVGVGFGVQDIEVVDFDADGDLDIVGAFVSSFTHFIRWFENDGNSNFSNNVIFSSTIDRPSKLEVIDADGDGDIDILACWNGDGISWLENDGDQNLTAHPIALTSLTSQFSGFAIGDFNGDGFIDMAMNTTTQTSWFENDGAGNFSESQISTSIGGNDLRAADIDGDGDVDLVGGSGNLIFYENNGAGNFTMRTTATPTTIEEIFVADLDSDGDLDVIVSGQSSRVMWFENTTIGCATPPTANVGVDQSICGGSVLNLNSSFNNASSAAWSTSGDGVFDDPTSLTATYSPGTADVTLGTATLTLTTNDPDGSGPCVAASDQLLISIAQPSTVDAGIDQTICLGATATLAGNIGGGASTATWSSSGTGSFDNATSLAAIYTPSAADESAGSVTLTLTVPASPPCPSVMDALVLTISGPISASAISQNADVNIPANTDVISASTINAGDVITVTITQNGTKGTATVLANNTIDYIANLSTSGTDVIDYQICNQCGSCSSESITYTIFNQPPTFASTPINVVTGSTATVDVLSFFSDPNNDIDPTTLTILTAPTSGTSASINASNQLVIDYTAGSFAGTDNIEIEVCDTGGNCLQQIITVQVSNTAPSVSIPAQTAAFNGVLSIDLSSLITDPEGNLDLSSLAVTQNPVSNANVSFSGTTMTVDYSATNFAGSDSFIIQVCDLTGACSQATIGIVINNEAPTITATSQTIVINSSATFDLSALISDPDNNLDPTSFKIVSQPTSGAVASISNGTLTIDYTGTGFAGTDMLTIEACDLAGVCTQATITILVEGDIIVNNGISPNGDGQNDHWIIRNIAAIEPSNTVSIFTRWGDKVFEVENYDNVNVRFEGLNDSGNELSSGTYFYKIRFFSGRKEMTGYLLIKR